MRRGNVLIVSASQRANSLSQKVACRIKQILTDKGIYEPEAICSIDLNDYRDALWRDDENDRFLLAREYLDVAARRADALIYVVPEWNGMAPPLAKNFFVIMCDGQIAHKPGLLISVSAGNGGAYPIFELRASSYKNTKICWIPEHFIARPSVVISDDDDTVDIKGEQRMVTKLHMLAMYSDALMGSRESLSALSKRYPYGM